VLLVGCACGCTGEGDDRAASDPDEAAAVPRLASCDGPPPGQHVEITFVHSEQNLPAFNVMRADRIEEYVRRFEHAHPDIDVDVVAEPDGADTMLSDWRSRPPHARPELALLPQAATGRLIDSGQTVAPGGCSRDQAADMLPAIREAWSSGGVLRAMPFSVSTPVLLYDRAAFRAADLDPDRPPETLDDVRYAANKARAADAAKIGFLFDTGPEGGASWMLEHVPARTGRATFDADNGRDGTPTAVTWQEGPAVETLRWLSEGLEDGWATSIGRNTSGIDDLRTAADPATRAAMLLHTCGALGGVFRALDAGLVGPIDLGVAPLPRPEGGPDPVSGWGSLPGGAALWIAGGKSDAETAAAWELASFLGSPQIQAEWAALTGYVPISIGAAQQRVLEERWQEHPEMRVGFEVLADQGTTPFELGPLAGPLAEIRELEADAMDLVVDGTDPAEALADTAADAERLLAAYSDSRPDPGEGDGNGRSGGSGG
jgi:sn-glycerol 3-phosphate transport system substrate-binding protein